MKRYIYNLLLAITAFFSASPALAGPWLVGQQPIHYTTPHVLGDGSNTRGGEAPFFTNGEPDDTPTPSNVISAWTVPDVRTVPCAPNDTYDFYKSPTDSPATNNCPGPGHEAKARFDCNDAFDENSDPIIKPGQAGTSPHRHHFFGNVAAAGNMTSVNYAWLRTHGYSTCYGGPMNRTLYWEPSMYVLKGGIPVSVRTDNVITYYISCSCMTPSVLATMTRWPRSIDFIFGKDPSDPTNNRMRNQLVADGITPTNSVLDGYSVYNGFAGYSCSANRWATPSYNQYSPRQQQGAPQPWLNDGAGHVTLLCNGAAYGGLTNAIGVSAGLDSQDCWDGRNPTSPDGRSHVAFSANGGCPNGWYKIPIFEPGINIVFKDNAEMATAYLSSDKMPGMPLASFTGSISGFTLSVPGAVTGTIVANHVLSCTGCTVGTKVISGSGTTWTLDTSQTVSSRAMTLNFNGGETFHADLIPAWDYGTGDNTGFMLGFFQHCLGLTMHVKNADGVNYTDLPGDPHECGYARVDQNRKGVSNSSPPECGLVAGTCPNPVVDLDPAMTGTKRFFPIPNGTPLPSFQIHQKSGMVMPVNDNQQLAGAVPINYDVQAAVGQ